MRIDHLELNWREIDLTTDATWYGTWYCRTVPCTPYCIVLLPIRRWQAHDTEEFGNTLEDTVTARQNVEED